MSGKWHVTHYDYSHDESKFHRETWPLQRGFDRFFGTLSGAGSFFSPVSLMLDNEFIEPGDDFYYTDQISDHAVRFIEEADKDQPFLLYVAHVAPHWPLHARPEHIEMFKDAFKDGWDNLRDARYQRMIETGIINPAWPLTPRDSRVPDWQNVPHKEWEAHRMAVYAAQMHSMDQGIGRIIETLKQTGRYENTLIIFLSDNGASSEIIGGRDTRHGYYEKGGTDPEIFPGGPDTYASYGVGWANVGNTPFRLYKKWMHEGGIATPMIAHWPLVIKNKQISHKIGHIIDIMPTLIDVAKTSYPESLRGRELTPLEGLSLLPEFLGDEGQEHQALYWEHMGNKAMRQGIWKLVSADNGEWELYDMQADRTELKNLIREYPDKAASMEAMWEEWALRAIVK
jgi:arylsulfatase